ncbi:M48 family metalloprotease [bacterium]|nr:M48 family metalloprotease [bacterium]
MQGRRGRRFAGGIALAAGFAALCVGLALSAPQAVQAGGFKFKRLFKMSKSQERSIAREMNAELERDPGFVTEGERHDLVQRMGKRIVGQNGLDEYDYQFFLVKQQEVNAFATPGGYIYVTEGLLNYMAYDEGMLAGVMAHELGHAKDRHVANGFEKMLKGYIGLGILGLFLGKRNQDVMDVLKTGGEIVYLKYNRDQEEWADRHGVELAYGAGYDAYGMLRGLECLEALYGSADEITVWLQNHPATDDRIGRTTRIARETSSQEHGYMPIPCPPESHPLYEQYKDICAKKPAPVIKRTQPINTGKQTQPLR